MMKTQHFSLEGRRGRGLSRSGRTAEIIPGVFEMAAWQAVDKERR